MISKLKSNMSWNFHSDWTKQIAVALTAASDGQVNDRFTDPLIVYQQGSYVDPCTHTLQIMISGLVWVYTGVLISP